MTKGRARNAIDAARRAQRLDPLSPTLMTWTSSWLAYAGKMEEGQAELERQVAMHPGHWLPRHYLGELLARRGRLREAATELEASLELSGAASISLALLAIVRILMGDRRGGDELVSRLQRRAEKVYVAPMFLAWVHLAQGDDDAALARTREALNANDGWLGFHRFVVPALAPADPRVEELLASELP
jgi:predicted Zn-dependent protease